MTFGFWLAVVLPHGERLGSDEQVQELELAPPIGRATFRASPHGASFKDAERLVFTGAGYETFEAAERAGRALKNAIRLAAVDVGKAVDVGQDLVRGRPGQVVIDRAAQDGAQLLPDVHGLQVYEETGTPMVISIQAEARVIAPLANFIDALNDRSSGAVCINPKRALACDLFAQSRFEFLQKSRHLTLVTALEVLSERQVRSGAAAQLVEDFRKAIKYAAREYEPGTAERRQLDSLLGAANDLRRESISSAIQRLASSGFSESTGEMQPTEVARMSYQARSDLVHSGATDQNLTELLGPLERL